MYRAEIDLNDHCASIEMPDDIVHHDILRVQIYKAAVNDIVKQSTKVHRWYGICYLSQETYV